MPDRLGFRVLYLFTPSAQDFFLRLGWHIIEHTRYRDTDVVIMSYNPTHLNHVLVRYNPHVKTSVTELPFNRFLGIQISTEPSQLLRLPSGEQYLNHLGTVHASAQLALAEASSGEFLLRHFGSTEGLVPVVRRLEAKFRKPANGAVTSVASAAPESLAQLDAELASKGRSDIPTTVELHDESGAHTLSATVEWFIHRLPTNAQKTDKTP